MAGAQPLRPPRPRNRARPRPPRPAAAVMTVAGDSEWYRKAVFYEVGVRGFYDASGDGSGDFVGLTEKLDYLQWLGVYCIWPLPFYESPLRDGGYDVSEFFNVLPEYGTIGDA